MHAIRTAALAALLMFSSPLLAHPPTAKPGHSAALPHKVPDSAALADAFHAALRKGDGDAALALLADDVLILESGGAERSKAEYQAHHLAADMAFSQAVPSVVTHRSGDSSGSTAWIASEGRITGSYKGKPVDQVTAETMVLRKIDGKWRIVHIHWSSSPKR